jgi:hypothetical protein
MPGCALMGVRGLAMKSVDFPKAAAVCIGIVVEAVMGRDSFRQVN